MPRGYGHIVGCDNLGKMCDVIKDMGVKYLTVYAFSTENWKRSRAEVEGLLKLFRQYLKRCIKKAHKKRSKKINHQTNGGKIMKYIEFDESRPMDLVLLGRVAIDFNPAYNDQVKEEFKPLKKVHMFEKFVGGSPANIAVGVTKHGLKAGFIGKVSDDQFGEYVVDYFDERGIDTSQIQNVQNGEKLGLTFTEMLSPKESSILMYRNRIADLQLHVDDIHEDYIKKCKKRSSFPELLLQRALPEKQRSKRLCLLRK